MKLTQMTLAVGLPFVGLAAAAAQTNSWSAYMLRGDQSLQQGRYAEAESSYRAALFELDRSDSRDPRRPLTLNNLALVYRITGQYMQAEPLYKQALGASETVFGPDDPQTATIANNLAELYRMQGRYGKAEPLYLRALGIREKVFGPKHEEVALVLNNLGSLHRSLHHYSQAEDLYRRAQRISEDNLGPVHPDVATSLHNLGALFYVRGRYTEAEALLVRAMEIREKVRGPNHPEVATTLNYLSALYCAQSRYREAEPLIKRSIDLLNALWVPGTCSTLRAFGFTLQSSEKQNARPKRRSWSCALETSWQSMPGKIPRTLLWICKTCSPAENMANVRRRNEAMRSASSCYSRHDLNVLASA